MRMTLSPWWMLMASAMATALTVAGCTHTLQKGEPDAKQQQTGEPPLFVPHRVTQTIVDGRPQFVACTVDCPMPTPKVMARPSPSTSTEPVPPSVQVQTPVPERGLPQIPPVVDKFVAAPMPLQLRVDYTLNSWWRLYFRFGTARLGPNACNVLKAALPDLKKAERVEIFAGVDPVGSATFNADLQRRRFAIVKRYLVNRGVKSSSIFQVASAPAIDASKFSSGDIGVRGMPARDNSMAEMRRAEIVGRTSSSR